MPNGGSRSSIATATGLWSATRRSKCAIRNDRSRSVTRRGEAMADSLTREKRIDLLERMLLMRRFEEMVIHVAAAHKYIGRNHLYIGHEATGAVIMSLLGN